MIVYLIRHGETTWNAEGRFQGHLDSPLSGLGLRQAEAVAERLASEPLKAVWSSDLSRARDTALAIASRHGLPVIETPHLREQSHGLWEGMTVEDILNSPLRAAFEAYRQDSRLNAPPRGETLRQLYLRNNAALEAALLAENAGPIALVGHTGSVRSILCKTLGSGLKGMRQLWIGNASISVLEVSGARRWVRQVNDTSHLHGD